jgi:hypothetical protein
MFAAGLSAVIAIPASAQGIQAPSLPTNSPFAGGVPDGMPTPGTLSLSVAEVIRRALDHNLGVLAATTSVDRARGERWIALSQLLPNVSGSISESRQVRNLEAFGFRSAARSRRSSALSTSSMRVFASQSVFDLHAINDSRQPRWLPPVLAQERARPVVLVAPNLYLQTVASAARADSARGSATAKALFDQATSLRQAASLPIDVAGEVRLATERSV